ncbi:MAG: hypothetical protein FJX55_20900 [Alphaproteobacteria bacterium]|nr:hypothetical protein [Alphaproteobacteria bacterium]
MGDATNILLALSVMTIGLEVLLFVFKGPFQRADQSQALQARIGAAQAEVAQAQQQVAARQAEKATADIDLAKARAALKQAEDDLAAGRRPREVLVHRIGAPAGGTLFQANVAKVLPTAPEPNQALLWSYDNVVELHAGDAATARKVASRAFPAKAGYTLGEFQRVDLPAVFAPSAASPREAA